MKNRHRIFAALLAIVMALSATVLFSGCINKDATPLKFGSGVTMYAYRNGDSYFADFIILVPVNKMRRSYGETNDYLKRLFNRSHITLTSPADPSTDSYNVDGVESKQFVYTLEIPDEDWVYTADPKISNGFLNITVDYVLTNPFALFNKSGHVFNEILGQVQQEISQPDPTNHQLEFLDVFYDVALGQINTTTLIATKYNASANTGEIVYDSENRVHFYRNHASFGSVADANLDFSYTVMATYGYFAIAVVLGGLTVLLILMLAKKKQGRTVDLTPNPAQNADVFGGGFTQNPYAPYKKPDPFDRDDDDNNAGGAGSSGTGSSGSGGGGVFDGF